MAKPKSKGTQWQVTIAASLTAIANLTEITAPAADVGTFDATALDGGVGREKKVTGFADGGSLKASGFFDPVATGISTLTGLLAAPATNEMAVVWSDSAATSWPFTGILKSLEPKASVDDGLKFDAEVEVDGLVTYP